jgi:hypothetical protein
VPTPDQAVLPIITDKAVASREEASKAEVVVEEAAAEAEEAWACHHHNASHARRFR